MTFNIDHEIVIVAELLNVPVTQIEVNETGWMSRVYIVNEGEFVFKFPRRPEVKDDHRGEVKIYRLLEDLDLGVQVPKVCWVHDDYDYIGYEGVVGTELRDIKDEMSPDFKSNLGTVLGNFLRKLHLLTLDGLEQTSLEDEVSLVNEKYANIRAYVGETFSSTEQAVLEAFVGNIFPTKTHELGIKPVLCHGDLGYHNIVVKQDVGIGVIDFGDLGYYDESQDFRVLADKEVRDVALETYGTTELLTKKVELRASVIPFRELDYYLKQEIESKVETAIGKIKNNLATGKYN